MNRSPIRIEHSPEKPRKTRRQRVNLSTRNALLLSFISVLFGGWYSLSTHDWSWFARSGSVVVIIGILLTSSQIIENSRRLKKRRHYNEDNFHRDFANDYPAPSSKHHQIYEEDIWVSGLHGLYLLVAGTLIWGFGDLLGILIH